MLAVTQRIVSRLVNLLYTYNLRELSEDVLKELYQGLVDPKERRELGEFYTPDWLAALMCEKLLQDSGEEAVLDPACGSGTFLYQVIRQKRRCLPETRQSLEKILGSVVGIDIHPLAVNIAKVNVLLALGDLILKRGDRPVSVQVYLADSIRHLDKQRTLGEGGESAEKVELNRRQVLIPEAALASPATLDATIRVAHEFAKAHARDKELRFDSFENYLRLEAPEPGFNTNVKRMLFELAETLG